MSEQQPIDLTDGRSITTHLGGKPVYLTPMPDGTIAVTEHPGRPPVRTLSMDGVWAELSGDPAGDPDDALTDDEMFAAWQSYRNGDAPEASTPWDPEPAASLSETADEDEDDGFTDDGLYDAWKESYAAERGVDPADLAETGTALKPGDAVEWGSGHGVGHGIVMEVDTSTGNVNVHTCEVVTEGGAGPQLSPTGKTMKMDGAKLRKTSLVLVGEEPVGPELSADLSDGDPDTGNESDDSFYERVKKQLRRMGGGFGAE